MYLNQGIHDVYVYVIMDKITLGKYYMRKEENLVLSQERNIQIWIEKPAKLSKRENTS